MTYGWVIAVLAVVVGILYYYGVFTPETFIKSQVIGFSTFYIPEGGWKLAASNSVLTLYLTNQIDHNVNVTNVYIDEELKTSGNLPKVIASGKSETISINTGKTGNNGDSYKISVSIEFSDMITSILHNDTGTIVGKFE